LRPHGVGDFDDSFALWSDPDITRHISGQPQSREAVWQRLLRYAGLWSLLGYGYWAVFERDGGRFVGEVGLADFHRDIDWHGDAPECGWVISPRAQGRGYATEAVVAALDWRDRKLAGKRTVCLISPNNGASLRIAAKVGFRYFSDADYHGPVQLYERITT
jgi:RimJ/RimL family protein N-acetyltransferase